MEEKGSFWWYVTIESKGMEEETLISLVDLSGSMGSELLDTQDKLAVKAYYRSSHALEYWISKINEVLEPWPTLRIIDAGKIENERWHTVWKEAFPPIEVGKALVVMAPWHKDSFEDRKGKSVLLVYPGTAFGTGYHESTQIALELLEKSVNQGDVVADVGTGSGILAIAAVKLGAKKVFARDLDPAVLEEVESNLKLNEIPEDLVEVEQGNLLDGLHELVDLVTANIIFDPLIKLLPSLPSKLKKGGRAVFSGLVKKERDPFISALQEIGFKVLEETTKGDWWGVVAQNTSGGQSENR
ncbi:50S ribosomal protein L11 methyltransferase [Thermovirga sp.]|uniref:50S ribosomal protein L11 methyltransferase n=1 Tax=Thermovirga sp. TaxID=2699834 RepID=UPI0026015595|nr:50S ribosomal protein L11 methyltransferase [Thermovirga sp.]MBO8153449.1 50S ribosomal protein L11 methyltransferase [Thermovirga sp.]